MCVNGIVPQLLGDLWPEKSLQNSKWWRLCFYFNMGAKSCIRTLLNPGQKINDARGTAQRCWIQGPLIIPSLRAVKIGNV